MTIENKNRELPFDGDLVSITRRYYRSGDGEYLINNATVRLKDIHELFMDTGLNETVIPSLDKVKSTALYLLARVIAVKFLKRRRVSPRYRYRKEESERKLFQAEENLVRLHDIVSELKTG